MNRWLDHANWFAAYARDTLTALPFHERLATVPNVQVWGV